jgi:RNA recognition motif-containing protein
VSKAKVFVGNLSFNTTREQLETLFSQAGDIVEVFLPTDRATGRPRGFGFVEFSGPSEAAEAIDKFNGYEFGGRELRVNEAQDRPRRPPMMDDAQPFGSGYRPGKPSRPKGSRRNVRGKKRSL